MGLALLGLARLGGGHGVVRAGGAAILADPAIHARWTGWGLGPIRISEHSIAVGLAVFARCLAIGWFSLVLVGTVPLHHTLAAAHRVRVPGMLVLIAGLAYRYTFLPWRNTSGCGWRCECAASG